MHHIDAVTGAPFWYNEDTGEASYGKPAIIQKRDTLQAAAERKYNAFPLNLILHVLSYLPAYPDRIHCSSVCARWSKAAFDSCFYKVVLPIETGAKDNPNSHVQLGENTFSSIADALATASTGDTISLGNGHHWETSIQIDTPVRLIGAQDGEASSVFVEVAAVSPC